MQDIQKFTYYVAHGITFAYKLLVPIISFNTLFDICVVVLSVTIDILSIQH